MAGEFFVLFALFALGAPLALYALIRAEQGNGTVADRESAERAARRDADDEP
jgi:multisubunit Na+/H+ antiporter MnhG subunit